MSYLAAIEELRKMTPELHPGPGGRRRKFSLDQVRILLTALGGPEQKFPSVLIAGTNGKGSTAATLASILIASGLRTGLYTSPHLERVNERVQVNNVQITDEDFARKFFEVRETAERLVSTGELVETPSYFETLTALAFSWFAEVGVEAAVVEVGLGGRLDATNVVEPLVSIVTDISMDHMEWLGSTIDAIAREKAGILRRGGIMVTLPQLPEASKVLDEVAAELGSRSVSAVRYLPSVEGDSRPYRLEVLGKTIEVRSPLKGAHQHRNVALAIAAAVELKDQFKFPVSAESIAAGVAETVWPGRLERFEGLGVDWVLDVAHNPAGAWALRSGLQDLLKDAEPACLVFSCLRDKPVREMAQILFPLFTSIVLAPLHGARATEMDDLAAAAEQAGTPYVRAVSVVEALSIAQEQAQGGIAVVSGSVYLVGETRTWLRAQGVKG
jgi:dihydrofolate synthase/folylpolyglutamate synthase